MNETHWKTYMHSFNDLDSLKVTHILKRTLILLAVTRDNLSPSRLTITLDCHSSSPATNRARNELSLVSIPHRLPQHTVTVARN